MSITIQILITIPIVGFIFASFIIPRLPEGWLKNKVAQFLIRKWQQYLVWKLRVKIKYFGRKRALQRAINTAESNKSETGKRYRVYFIAWRYRVLCREDIKHLKKVGFLGRKANITKLEDMQVYDTEHPFQLIKK